jgi:hypothetical protein
VPGCRGGCSCSGAGSPRPPRRCKQAGRVTKAHRQPALHASGDGLSMQLPPMHPAWLQMPQGPPSSPTARPHAKESRPLLAWTL